MEAQLQRLRPLVAQGAATEFEVEELERRQSALQKDLLGRGVSDEPASAWDVVAAAKRLDALEVRLDQLHLRSTLNGQVAELLHQPGEMVSRGEPVMRVRPVQVDEVIAWLPTTSELVVAGAPSTVVRSDGSELAGEVVSIGAGPTLRPARSWLDPRREEWGIAVVVRLQNGDHVAPDEAVLVRL